MRFSQPAPRASNASRVELKQDWQGRDPRPRMGHHSEAACPGLHGAKVCLPTLEPAPDVARVLAAAVAGPGMETGVLIIDGGALQVWELLFWIDYRSPGSHPPVP